MKLRAQKQNQPQQQVSSNTIRSISQPHAASQAVHPLIQLQRLIGNQAVQRLLHANAEGLGLRVLQRQAKSVNEPAVKTEVPSPRASMLLDMFTKNRSGFRRFSGSEFQRESNDKDASVETIQTKIGGTNWTYQFVTNNKTGAIYVRQSQDETQIVNFYEPIATSGCEAEKFEIKFWESSDKYFNESDVVAKLTSLAKILEGNPGLRVTVSGNVYSPSNPQLIKGNSDAALAQNQFYLNGKITTAAELMLARARRAQQTLYEDLKVTNVITPTTGSIMENEDGLKIFITICKPRN
jgi:hypothetical protein